MKYFDPLYKTGGLTLQHKLYWSITTVIQFYQLYKQKCSLLKDIYAKETELDIK